MPQLDTPNIEWLITKIGKLEREVEKLSTHEQYAGDHFLTALDGYVYVPLASASTLLDTTIEADVSSRTQIDVSGVLAALANAKAMNIEIVTNSASSNVAQWLKLHTASSGGITYQFFHTIGDADDNMSHHAVVNCGTDGDIWYTADLYSDLDMLVKIYCFGYWA